MTIGQHHLGRLAEETFERLGDNDSLFFEGTTYTSGQLFDRACRLAGGLIELGVEPGDRVVVMMANCPEVPIVYQALWRAGAAITPAIFLLPPDELKHVIGDSEARAVICSPEFLATVTAAARELPDVKWIISVGAEADGVIPLASLEESEPAGIVARDDADLAALMYTGGTTGRAKGVMLSHANLWSTGKASHDASHTPGLTRALGPLPLSHSYGLIVTVVGMHATEQGFAVLMRWFDPTAWLELAQVHRVQLGAMVPSMIQMLLALPIEDYDLSSLSYLVSGAAPLAADVANEFKRRVPGVEIREGYGLTESSAVISTNPPGAARFGSVGRPIPGCEVKVVDDDDNELPTGEIGEICARSPGIMLGYWKSPELTGEVLRGGWLHTGDMGHLDADGYVWIVDRKKDLIIRGGFNVYPRDVEDVLLEHPEVTAAAVVGRPDAKLGEEVVAFVCASKETNPDDLIAFVKKRLGGYKYPREVRIVPSIPLTPVGKIDRKAVRAEL
jgi:long-chain acyl-CoA synthetase